MKRASPLACAFLCAVMLPPCPALAPTARADGMFVSPEYRDIWEPGQKALILYDAESRRQDLVLQVNFYGDAPDFAWIVPLPARPDIEAAPEHVFRDCSRLTRPLRHRRPLPACGGKTLPPTSPADEGGEVEILSEEAVGVYQTLTVSAEDASALADSLDAWGYLHAQNQAEVTAALQFYVDKSWCFVAMRVDTTLIEDPDWPGYWQDQLIPLRFSFASERIVYPLRVSAVSTRVSNSVLIYVCADHRMTFDGARTEYANRITPGELAAIRSEYADLGQVLSEACFMTKLRKDFSHAEMTEDLAIERAASDDEFRRVDYSYRSEIPLAETLLLGGVAWLYSRARRRGRGSEAAKI